MPVPGADAAARELSGLRRIEQGDDVAADTARAWMSLSSRVVALGNDRKRHVVAAADRGMMLDHPTDDAVRGSSDVERVGQDDRLFEITRLLDPVRSGHLAVAVERKESGRDLVVPGIGVRADSGRSGTDVAALDLREIRDPYAGDVGDRVQGPRREEPEMKG